MRVLVKFHVALGWHSKTAILRTLGWRTILKGTLCNQNQQYYVPFSKAHHPRIKQYASTLTAALNCCGITAIEIFSVASGKLLDTIPNAHPGGDLNSIVIDSASKYIASSSGLDRMACVFHNVPGHREVVCYFCAFFSVCRIACTLCLGAIWAILVVFWYLSEALCCVHAIINNNLPKYTFNKGPHTFVLHLHWYTSQALASLQQQLLKPGSVSSKRIVQDQIQDLETLLKDFGSAWESLSTTITICYRFRQPNLKDSVNTLLHARVSHEAKHDGRC